MNYFKAERIWTPIAAVLAILVFSSVSGLINGVFVMLVWNWLMPIIFGLGKITFWQGWGLSFLCSILFTRTVRLNETKQ